MHDLSNRHSLIGRLMPHPLVDRLRAMGHRWRTRRDPWVDARPRRTVEDLAPYICAWSTDIVEELAEIRVVVGGVVDGAHRVSWSGLDSRVLWVLDDGRGLIQAAVPSSVSEDIALRWAESTLVVALGTVIAEQVVALDRVWTLTEVTEMGPSRFAAQVVAGGVER